MATNGAASATKITKKQVQAIQAIRRKRGVSDDVWAQMKRSVGVESTLDLNDAQFDELLGRLGVAPPVRTGSRKRADPAWKPMHHTARASGMHVRPPADREAMIRQIEAVLTDLGLPWSYADGIAHRMFGVELLRFCSPQQTHKVQQALLVRQRKLASRALYGATGKGKS